jgi:predicted RNase H-like HicB family nuclease
MFRGMSQPQCRRYRVFVHRVRHAYFARVAELPGCVAQGATEVEAIENLRVAIRTFALVADLLACDAAIVQLEISA